MQSTQQRLVHVGFGSMICANCIEAILIPGTACAKRLQKAAKLNSEAMDLTFGRMTKSLLLLEDGKLICCALTPKTIAARINTPTSNDGIEGEEEDENTGTVREAVDPT